MFCQEHAKLWFPSNMECPVCQTGEAVRVIKVDFNRPRREKELALLGLLPGEALQAASEAFRFWSFQKALEHDWSQHEHADLQLQGRRLKTALTDRGNAADIALYQLSKKGTSLSRELTKAAARRDFLQEELGKARKRLARSQPVQLETLPTKKYKEERSGLLEVNSARQPASRSAANLSEFKQDRAATNPLPGSQRVRDRFFTP